MNTTRCWLALLPVTVFLAGCTGATFHPADRIDADGDGFFAVEDPDGVLSDREYLILLAQEDADFDIAAAGLDCDDTNDNTFPDAAEQCDGEDNDCDGNLADDEADRDEDGYSVCAWEHDFNPEMEDCNDDPTPFGEPEDGHHLGELQHPGRTEVCAYHPDVAGLQLGTSSPARTGRLLDDDCNGSLLPGEVDQDLDGFTECRLIPDITVEYENPVTVLEPDDPFDPDNPQNGLQSDCVDSSAELFPGNERVRCFDTGDYSSDCRDNDQELATIFFRDLDADGDGDANPEDSDGDGVPDVAFRTCTSEAPPGRWVAQPPAAPDEERLVVATDCDDFNPNQDGKDRDQDGFATCPNENGERDCNDVVEDGLLINPAAPELCDAIDNDCDGDVDEDYDDDGDGSFRVTQEDLDNPELPSVDCSARSAGYVEDCDDEESALEELDLDDDGESTCEGDCDDNDELQQSTDNDNDGFNTCTADISFFDCDDEDPALNPIDGDGDGFAPCPNAEGLADCDDTNIDVYPNNGTVQCDDIPDTDCDGLVDPLDADDDGDGVSECDGDCNDQDILLNTEDGDGDFVTTCGGDCDDDNATVYPGAPQVCNDDEPDNDCNGSADANEADVDGDGNTLCDGDCNDFDPAVSNVDADGDGSTPCDGDCVEDDPLITHLTDADNDGWTFCGSFGGSGPISQALPADCNDGDASMNWSDADADSQPTCTAADDDVTVADCDDFDPTMHDQDRDEDGVSPCGPDGVAGSADDDCDDDEALVSSALSELRDGLDNDCSGIADDLLDADPIPDGPQIAAGDLAIVEIMIGATAATGDGPAEYFEIFNNSGFDVDLRGWEVEVSNNTASTSWVFAPELGPGAELVVPDGSRAVIARSANATAYATDVADFHWAGPAFSDAGGSISLIFEGRPIDTLTWLGTDCIMNCEPGQPNPTFDGDSTWRPGHALGLSNLGTTPDTRNDNQVNLCEELTTQVSSTLYGSPGTGPSPAGFGDCIHNN